jgi:PAS domain S-box-containing protein
MSKISILIVEDEGIVAENLSGKLGQLGYDVSGIAMETDEAIEMALQLRPQLILMDIQLDGRNDGIQAAEAIQGQYDVPVIYLTAHSDPATLARAKLTGPFGYILKPFEMRDLATQIELALYKHQADRQLREQREWLRVTLTSIGDAVIACDADGRVSFVNPVAESLIGWPVGEAIGQPVSSVFRIVNEQTGRLVEEPVVRVLREGKTVPLANHTALVTRSGRTIPIEDSAAPIRDAAGQVVGVVLVFHDVTEKRRVEEERQHHRLLMAEAEKLSNTGAWEWDLVADRWTFSEQWLAIHGCPDCTLTPAQLLTIVHPDDRAAVDDAMEKVRSGVASYDIEHRIVRMDDGDVRIVHGYGHFVKDDLDNVVKVYGFARDITESRQAELALRVNERRWAVTLSSIGDAVIATDTDGKVTFLNPVAEHLTRWSMAEATGRPVREVFDIVNEETRATVDDPASKVLQSGNIAGFANHTVLLKRGGGEVPIDDSGAPIRDEQGNILGVVLVFRDISERKKADKAQKTSKERQELLTTVAERLLRAEDPQAIVEDLCQLVMKHIDCQFFFNYLVEEPGKWMHLNACAGIPKAAADEIRRLDFGVAVCGCVARDCQRIIVGDIQNSDDLRTQLVKSFGVQAYCCHPLMVQDRLIGTLSFGTMTRPAFADDEVALMRSVCDQVAVAMQRLQSERELRQLNLTLEKQVAERTRQAEARSKQLQVLAVELIEAEERERRRVADHLHDDLQQILAAARMQLETVCQSQPEEPILPNVKRLLEESIEKSRRLSHQLSPPVLQHANLVAALEWIVRYYGEQFGLHVELEAQKAQQSESPTLKVFLFRAAQELLFNVVKHGGVKSARVVLSSNNGCLVLTVSDHGRGLNPEILDSAAVPSGLGLLSLRERARHIGGDLTIESAPASGSRFTLTVPVSITKIDEPKWPESGRPPAAPAEGVCAVEGGVTRVLFVDDHQVMRQGLINLIGAQPGIDVAGEAANGREAIDQVRQLKPDVVVMDVSMPEMDGIEATRHIKSQWPQVRVIALSMVEDEHISRAVREAGAEAFVSKTASSTELLKAIFGVQGVQGTPY